MLRNFYLFTCTHVSKSVIIQYKEARKAPGRGAAKRHEIHTLHGRKIEV